MDHRGYLVLASPTTTTFAKKTKAMLIKKVETSLLTEKMIQECDDFFQYIVIKRLSRGLRNQMFFYLTNEIAPFPDHKEFPAWTIHKLS